ncbi:GHMP family kinase ATP-binding protein [Caldovatus sediminis]|uniref:GHMP family kinase ATP-binding protein n=1 Tax=Caldovatus sediminis TaxID=2041189 RepID=UPI001E42032F|nr:GHMP kinase [Caldovatus sediminis]
MVDMRRDIVATDLRPDTASGARLLHRAFAAPVAGRKTRARAPLRLGLAGGGTDLSPYCDEFGGNVLNCTIGVYAHAVVEERFDWCVSFSANDIEAVDEAMPLPELPLDGGLALHRGVYNRIFREFCGGRPLAVSVHTAVDAPPGSGLGSSSALVVALVKAYAEFLSLPLGDYDIARLAYVIERVDLGMAGGRQDQYAAAFGGFNFIEFLPGDRVIVNPLRVHHAHSREFEGSLLVCHTGRSRISSQIIEQQTRGLTRHAEDALAAMHQIKQEAVDMKLCLLRGDIRGMARVLGSSWEAKKRTAEGVSNTEIERIYGMAMEAGAWAGKISGAGGGGFLMLLAPHERRPAIARRLLAEGLSLLPCSLTSTGAESWVAPA